MPTVFIPQVPSRYDHAANGFVPTIDLSAASKFGKVEILLPPEASRLALAPNYELIRQKLDEFDAEDWLVALGDPSILAAAACFASKRAGGFLRLLKWDRQARDYIPVELRI